jgi:hypothetical protein
MSIGSTEPLTSCVRCNTAFPLDARFCPNCGLPIEASLPKGRDSEPADPLIGHVVADRYRITSVLGSGGMGVVYRVEHVHIGKLMAMKVLTGRMARNENLRKRFAREAQTASKLSHPNTVQIFDFGESDQLAYLVMEYLPGRDLASLIAEGPLPFARVAAIAAQIAASVGEAHEHGIVHRDIKPENVMILDAGEEREFVKVLDFGIAKIRGVTERLTGMGELIGTPYYMAPEQINGDAVDHRADIYALGGLMHKALTGEPPFAGESPQSVITAHLTQVVPPLRRRAPKLNIPEEAERIVGRALQKSPAQRQQSMAELRDELLRYLRALGVPSGTFAAVPEQAVERAARSSDELVATRDDVEGYERRALRGSQLGKLALSLVLLLVAVTGYVLRDHLFAEEAPKDHESEPNDEPASADRLWPGIALKAKIGRRNTAEEGDPDVYVIELEGKAPRVANVKLSALPNMNLALDVVAKGIAKPLLSVNTGELGEPEAIPNITLTGDTYYLRVREVAVSGRLPTENISDEYTLELGLTPPLPGFEHELNEAYELATPLAPNEPLRGYIGWNKDRDVYCATPSQAAQTVTLSGAEGLDLVLSYLDRSSEAGQRIDRQGIGEGERLELPASREDRVSCFTVSAKEGEGAARSNPGKTYEIELTSGR